MTPDCSYSRLTLWLAIAPALDALLRRSPRTLPREFRQKSRSPRLSARTHGRLHLADDQDRLDRHPHPETDLAARVQLERRRTDQGLVRPDRRVRARRCLFDQRRIRTAQARQRRRQRRAPSPRHGPESRRVVRADVRTPDAAAAGRRRVPRGAQDDHRRSRRAPPATRKDDGSGCLSRLLRSRGRSDAGARVDCLAGHDERVSAECKARRPLASSQKRKRWRPHHRHGRNIACKAGSEANLPESVQQM